MGMGCQHHAPAALPRERQSTHCIRPQATGPVWTGAENLAPTGIRSPDRPARSESLYRLSYSGPHTHTHTYVYIYIYTRTVSYLPTSPTTVPTLSNISYNISEIYVWLMLLPRQPYCYGYAVM
jgi:hypothetical protein